MAYIVCTPVMAAATATPEGSGVGADNIGYAVGNVTNLTQTPGTETLLATAASRGQHAIAWRAGSTLHVAESRAGSGAYLESAAIEGEAAALAYDSAGRLHLAYTDGGRSCATACR